MSLRGLRKRLEEVERKLKDDFITLRLENGGVFRVRHSRLISIFMMAQKVAEPFDGRVPDEAVTDPVLQAVRDMQESDEHGGLLRLAQLALLGPVQTASVEFEQCRNATS